MLEQITPEGDDGMIPAKIDPISTSAIKDSRVESIIDLFDQHKQTFYTIGQCFLNNQQQIEELFYQSIIEIQKEWPRYKGKLSYEMWVTSIFIHNCRELSRDKSLQVSVESEHSLIRAIYQLNEQEKDAIVLSYIKGCSKEEVTHFLQVSYEKLKEILFSGIQSLRNERNSELTFNGCMQYQKDYIDYLERMMERQKKIDFEIHMYHCRDCQQDLASFQEIMLTMLDLTNAIGDWHVPSGFIENVKERLLEWEKNRQQKKKTRKRRGLILASVFTLLMITGFFSGAFTYLYYSWTEEDPELRAFLQADLGERLNLVAESNGVKITIKSVIADDTQTLVYYEIEDTDEDNQFMMTYRDGVIVENEYEILNRATYPRYYPPDLESDINKKTKNVYYGKMSLLPLTTDNGTIKLKVIKIQELIQESSSSSGYVPYENIEWKTGEWRFEIPVTKKPSIEYALNGQAKIEGVPIRFEKLILAPTTTILQFGLNNNENRRIINLNFNKLEVNNKQMKSDWFGSSHVNSQHDMNWSTLQTHFDPLFGEKPKKLSAQFASAYLIIHDYKTVELDQTEEYPQTFEYAGSTISIDKLEVGQATTIVLSNHDIENRAYESLDFNIIGENGQVPNSIEMNSEGVIVDKNGVTYDVNNMPFSYEEIEQPRYLQTVQTLRLIGFKGSPGKLDIYGYSKMEYLDDVVEISLE